MINLLLGAPGGGKSYEAVVYHILEALKEGRKVITNLPLNLEHFKLVMPEKLHLIELRHPTPDNLRPFSQITDYGDDWRHPETDVGPLYVIDEAHMALSNRSTPQEVEEWYSTHRHELADVLLLTQSYGKINKPIRELVQLVYRVRKNTALGDNSSYVRKVQDGLRGEVVNTNIRKYKPEYFSFYKSHTRSSKAATEAFAKDVRPIWRHWSVYGAAFFLSIAIYMAFAGYLNPFGSDEPEPDEVAEQINPVKRAVYTPTVEHQQPPQLNRHTSEQDKRYQQQQAELEKLKKEKEEREKSEHPLKKVELHIGGYLVGGGKYLYLVTASQNGQKIFQSTTDEMERMGYTLIRKSECLLGIRYEKYSEWLTCDAPRVGVSRRG